MDTWIIVVIVFYVQIVLTTYAATFRTGTSHFRRWNAGWWRNEALRIVVSVFWFAFLMGAKTANQAW